jgi:hypothetical protein
LVRLPIFIVDAIFGWSFGNVLSNPGPRVRGMRHASLKPIKYLLLSPKEKLDWLPIFIVDAINNGGSTPLYEFWWGILCCRS